jgi:hypothetical protein
MVPSAIDPVPTLIKASSGHSANQSIVQQFVPYKNNIQSPPIFIFINMNMIPLHSQKHDKSIFVVV